MRYPTAEEACIVGEFQRRIAGYAANGDRQYRYTAQLGPDNFIGDRVCQGVIYQNFNGLGWLPIETLDSQVNVHGSFGSAGTCTLAGYADPENGQCGIPKCSDGCQAAGGNGSNPIGTANGNKFQRETDFVGGGVSPLRFERYYNSNRTITKNPQVLGVGWTHTYMRRVVLLMGSDGSTLSKAKAYRANGSVLTFNKSGANWVADGDVPEKLSVSLSGANLLLGATLTTSADATETYDQLGRLTSIKTRDGYVTTLSYVSGVNTMYDVQSVTDPQGRKLTLGYSGGRLTSLVNGAGIQINYNHTGTNLTSVVFTVETGTKTRSYLYNEAGQTAGVARPNALTGLVDENGDRAASWGYDSAGRANLSTRGPFASALGRTSLTYNANGTTAVTDANGQTRTFSFEVKLGVAHISSVSVPCNYCAGSAASRTYDANGYPLTSRDFKGTDSLWTFNSRGLETQRIEAETIPNIGPPPARIAPPEKRTIDTVWGLSNFRIPTQRTIKNSGGTLMARTDWLYNIRGQTIAQCEYDPLVTASLSYVCVTTGETPTGVRRTTFSYCDQVDATCPFIGLLLSINGPRDNTSDVVDVTNFIYYVSDAGTCGSAPTTCPYRKGDLKQLKNALLQVTSFTNFDGNGRLLSHTNANGVSTAYGYNYRGWLVAQAVRGLDNLTTTDDAYTRFTYDAAGKVTKLTRPDGDYLVFTLDDFHRVTDVKDNENNWIHYTLNNAGFRTREDTKDSAAVLRRTLSRTFDSMGRVQQTLNAANLATIYTFDDNGNVDLISEPAPLNQTVDNDFDPLNRQIGATRDLGGLESAVFYAYDALDNLVQVSDPKGLATTYAHNGLRDVTQRSSPDTGTTTFLYDSAGNQISQTDGRPLTTATAYDALNRVVSVTYPPNQTPSVTYVYDANNGSCFPGNSYPIGHLTKFTDGSGSTELCYDRFGNLSIKTQFVNGVAYKTVYEYSLGNRLVAVTYPSLAYVEFNRNTLGQVSSANLRTSVAGPLIPLISAATYYPFGPIKQLSFDNGSGSLLRSISHSYDLNYSIDSIIDSATNGLSLDFVVDPLGTPTRVDETYNGTVTTRQFQYDGLNRLTLADTTAGTPADETFTYDLTGDRLSKKVGAGATQLYVYPGNSHRLSSVSGLGRSYDGAGNAQSLVTGSTTWGFAYAASGRMSGSTLNGSPYRDYVHNAFGERVLRTDPAGVAVNFSFVFDQERHMLGEYNAVNGARLREYIWLDDLLVGVIAASDGSSAGYQVVESDHHGTPRIVFDPIRNVAIWRWSANGSAFGDHQPTQDPDANGTTWWMQLRFPGQYFDGGSNQPFYNYSRDYDASTGRYVESDELGIAGGIATYAYANSSPIAFVDPNGTSPKPDPPQACDFNNGYTGCKNQQHHVWNCNQDKCTYPCTNMHEWQHFRDNKLLSPNGCKNTKDGDPPGIDFPRRMPLTNILIEDSVQYWHYGECMGGASGLRCALSLCNCDASAYIKNAKEQLDFHKCEQFGITAKNVEDWSWLRQQ